MPTHHSILALGLIGVLAASPVRAEKADDRLRIQLRDTISQLRAVTSENAQLKASLAQATAQPAEDPARVGRLQKSLTKLQAEHDQLQIRLQEASSIQKAEADAKNIAAETAQRDRLASLQKQLAEQRNAERNGQALAQCTADNQTLVSIAGDLIQRYRDRGVFDAALAREPITGLHRAQLERMAQTYEIRVGDHTLQPAAAPAADTADAASKLATGPGK